MLTATPFTPRNFINCTVKGSSHRLSNENSPVCHPLSLGRGLMFHTTYGLSAFLRSRRSFQLHQNAMIPGTANAAPPAPFNTAHQSQLSSTCVSVFLTEELSSRRRKSCHGEAE